MKSLFFFLVFMLSSTVFTIAQNPYFTLKDFYWSSPEDNDCDGFLNHQYINFKLDFPYGSGQLKFIFYYKLSSSSSYSIWGNTPNFNAQCTFPSGCTSTWNSIDPINAFYPLSHGIYDFKIEVWSGSNILDSRSKSNDSDLGNIKLETFNQDVPVFLVDHPSYSIGAKLGDTAEVNITCDQAWTVNFSAVDFFDISPTSGNGNGKIYITAKSDNPTTDSRTSQNGFIIQTPCNNHIILRQVHQEGATPYIDTNYDTVILDYNELSFFNLSVMSNSSWTATSNENWLGVDLSSGTGNQTVKLTSYVENVSGSFNFGVLELKAGNISKTVVIKQRFKGLVGMDEMVKKKFFSIYPNPASNFISFETDEKHHGVISVFDTNGKLVFKMRNVVAKGVIDISVLSKGFYFVKLVYPNSIYNSRFVKLCD